MKKYLLANLETGGIYMGRLFSTRAEVERIREVALQTDGLTNMTSCLSRYVVCEVAPVKKGE